MYTLDGSEPTLSHGTLYSASGVLLSQLDEASGHALRARAFQSGCLPSEVLTGSFLVNQHPYLQQGRAISLTADQYRAVESPYGFAAFNGGSRPDVEGLGAGEGLWIPTSDGDYNLAVVGGRQSERLFSFELLVEGKRLQCECGIKHASSDFTRASVHNDELDAAPWGVDKYNKPSMSVAFRDMHGGELETKRLIDKVEHQRDLSTFKTLRLRAGLCVLLSHDYYPSFYFFLFAKHISAQATTTTAPYFCSTSLCGACTTTRVQLQ